MAESPAPSGRYSFKFEKFTPPVNAPTIGMMRSLTAELTMAVNAAPMTTATARSITLP